MYIHLYRKERKGKERKGKERRGEDRIGGEIYPPSTPTACYAGRAWHRMSNGNEINMYAAPTNEEFLTRVDLDPSKCVCMS
jgi:hypothetical protein